jgi:signal transduction histidine kinase
MTLYPTSIRAKLTITAVVVMGVLFLAMGSVVQIAGREKIMASVDAELARQADEAIQLHMKMEKNRRPPPPDGLEGPGGPNGPGPGPDDGPGGGPGPGRAQAMSPADGKVGQPSGPSNRGGPRRGPGPGRGFAEFQRALRDIGDRLLSIGPRFVAIDEGPPVAPPDMQEPYDRSAIAQAVKRGTVFSDVPIDGKMVRIVTKLAKNPDGRRWVTQFPHPLTDVDRAIDTLNETLLILLPCALLLTAFASMFLMGRVMRPIREISQTADSISGEDLTGRLKVAGKDEFALLGGTINGMLGRLEDAFIVQKQTLQRLEAVLKQQRRFTADASHELKTPLAVIKANTGLLLQEKALSPDTKGSIEAVDSAATRMNRLVQGLMVLARTESGTTNQELKPFDLKIAVQNAIDQVHRPREKAVIYHDIEADVFVRGVERDVERVFVNLIDNACRHTRDNGNIDVLIAPAGGEAVVTITDDGDGIAPEHLPHVFDRFYRADSARSTDTGGTGLGLAICKGIVEAAGGSIGIESQLGVGTTVTVTFPLATGDDSTPA